MLAIIGSDDRLIPPENAERLHNMVPGSKFVLLDGAPHNAYWECAAEWNAEVDNFLGSL
ncbi:MAG: alpha/beta hydrolase [Dehalococcoidia bacterium]|nr:alpha/beta hydrolase [Dehalococcoidia bacterium]